MADKSANSIKARRACIFLTASSLDTPSFDFQTDYSTLFPESQACLENVQTFVRFRYSSWGGYSEGYALEKGSLGLRVSEPVTLSLQKSAKNRSKNPNSLRSDMRIFAPNADSCMPRVTKAPSNAIRGNLFPELLPANPK